LTNNLLPQALTTNTLAEAVNLAIQKAQAGDTILFSPGFASFGPPPGGFKNEFDRGDQFNELIKNLT
jgi:UDP-N-acetylmuramoylalanine--D-glutamate ligase